MMSKKVTNTKNAVSVITQDGFDLAKQCLIDNGIEDDEAEIVLQALCYLLLDEETEHLMSD